MDSTKRVAVGDAGGRPPSHGLYQYLALNTDHWPEDMRNTYIARYTQLMNLEHVDQELDAGLVSQVSRYEVLLDRVWCYLAENGLFDAQGNHHAVLNMLGHYENSLTRMYDKLGLTPESRKRLGVGRRGKGLAEILSGANDGSESRGKQ